MYRARRRLLSKYEWVVLYSDLRPTEPDVFELQSSELLIRPAVLSDTDGLLATLPFELVGHLPDARKQQMVLDRFRTNIPCFLALSGRTIVGGCWCPDFLDVPKLPIVISNPAFEIATLFVSASHRGKKIGEYLCRYACAAMAGMGYKSAISLVWYSRPASIRAHLNAHFSPIGQKSTYFLSGLRWSRFDDSHELGYTI